MHKQFNSHQQSLRTNTPEKIGPVFGEVGQYNTGLWTHIQIENNSKLCDLYGRETNLFKTVIQAIRNRGSAIFEAGADTVVFEEEDGKYRLFLKPTDPRALEIYGVMRLYPVIVLVQQVFD